MGAGSLAEAIILQSMEDLWSECHKEESLEFFHGKGYEICAHAAGMNFFEQVRLYNMVDRIAKRDAGGKKRKKAAVLAAA